ncbi:MAG: DNA polymerase III subunit delta, partial [Candidatus Acidiferrales bacterium]
VFRISATGSGLQELLQRAQMAPMLSPLQVLILQDTEALERGGDDALERTADALAAYLEDPAPFSIVVFEAEQLDRRKKPFKTLAAGALIVELSADVDPTALALHMARELGASISQDAAAELADAVDGEPAKIRLELEKLLLYVAGRQITPADVDTLVVSAKKYTVWKLADAFAARDRRASMELLDSLLREGQQPAGIVGALSWMYRKLVEARELPAGTNPYSAARDLGMRPEAAAIALQQARKIPREQLLAGIAILAEADSALKSGAPNPRATLEFVLARLTSSGAGTAA